MVGYLCRPKSLMAGKFDRYAKRINNIKYLENLVIRVYVDTSVFGGVFDKEFKDSSSIFFNLSEAGVFQIVTSAVVTKEIETAPDEVKDFFQEQLLSAEIVKITQEALILREAYLDSKILTERSISDALHVALASVSRCSMIIS